MIVSATIDVSGDFEFDIDSIKPKNLKKRKKLDQAKKHIEAEIKESLEDLFDEIKVRNIKIDFGLENEKE